MGKIVVVNRERHLRRDCKRYMESFPNMHWLHGAVFRGAAGKSLGNSACFHDSRHGADHDHSGMGRPSRLSDALPQCAAAVAALTLAPIFIRESAVARHLRRLIRREQNVCDFSKTFNVAIMTSVHFGHLPTVTTSFSCKRLEYTELPVRHSLQPALCSVRVFRGSAWYLISRGFETWDRKEKSTAVDPAVSLP